MDYSENYGFALPTAEDDILADIGAISENFKTVDEVMKQNSNDVERLDAKDTDLQSQINMLSGVDMSEFQSQLDAKVEQVNGLTGKSITLFSEHIKVANSSGETSTVADEFEAVYSMINRNNNSTNKDIDDLQSQIDALGGADLSEIQSQLDNKSDATNLVNGSAEGSLRGIGATEEDDTYTMGWRAFAEGNKTTASGNYSHAEGNNNTASGVGSHAEGSWATASGSYSHAEGYGTKAYSEASHAEGKSTTTYGEGSHAEGHSTTASQNCSHAEGYLTKASGKNSHAEGSHTESSGEDSHAEGSETTSSGDRSHAEGYVTTSSGYCSHVEGIRTIAGSYCQHVQGKYNIADNDNKYLHIVGNGSSDEDRSNAHTLDWDGNAWFAGDVYVGGTSQDDANAINLVNISTENKTDIEALKAKGQTLYQAIADLTARIEALESSAS